MSRRQPPSKWNDERIERELREIAGRVGHFPSTTDLRAAGRNDLSCAVTKHGGILAWSERIGIARPHSDSDTGWAGETAFVDLLRANGFQAERMTSVKHPFDILVDGVLRVDVKAARFAAYGERGTACKGWFYRIGKACQADVVVLYQLDTGTFYGIPWHMLPQTNVSVSLHGGKYAPFVNNWDLIREMRTARADEAARFALLTHRVA